mgnify:FL=1|tara:strand:+ start:1222 stop:1728 length:507 start_codon:yes stop_codon:yes gene_type:complete
MGEIINKVKSLDVITIDVKNFYVLGKREQFNLSDYLEDGILIEKNFRKKLMDFNWSIYKGVYVNVFIEKNQIIPSWAFLLLSHYLSEYSKDHVIGDARSLEEKLYNISLNNLDISNYKDKKVIIKGCSDIPYIEYVYSELTRRLSKHVLSLMYGEPCSRVPIFKKRLK